MFAVCNKCSTAPSNPDILDVLKNLLPVDEFKHLICSWEGEPDNFKATIRVNLASHDDVDSWKDSFNKSSLTTLRVERTKPCLGSKVLHKIDFKCQHKTQSRSSTANERRRSKNTNCPASVNMTVYNTEQFRRDGTKRANRSSDIHLIDYPAAIRMKFCHNHPIQAASSLRHRDVSEETKLKIEKLLLDGYLPAAALQMFKLDLQLEHPDDYDFVSSDRSKCPDKDYVYRLHYKLCQERYGSRTGKSEDSQLEDYVAAQTASCVQSWFQSMQEPQQSTGHSTPAANTDTANERTHSPESDADSDHAYQPAETASSSLPTTLSASSSASSTEPESMFADLDSFTAMLKGKVLANTAFFGPALAAFNRKAGKITSDSHLVYALNTFGNNNGISLPRAKCKSNGKRLKGVGRPAKDSQAGAQKSPLSGDGCPLSASSMAPHSVSQCVKQITGLNASSDSHMNH